MMTREQITKSRKEKTAFQSINPIYYEFLADSHLEAIDKIDEVQGKYKLVLDASLKRGALLADVRDQCKHVLGEATTVEGRALARLIVDIIATTEGED